MNRRSFIRRVATAILGTVAAVYVPLKPWELERTWETPTWVKLGFRYKPPNNSLFFVVNGEEVEYRRVTRGYGFTIDEVRAP